jgi:hypothetical protein
VLHAAASNINGFLWRDSCICSTQLESLVGEIIAHLHLQTPMLQEVFFQNLNQFTQGDNVLDAAVSKTDGYLWRDICVSSGLLKTPIWSKRLFAESTHYKTNSILT